MAHNAPKTLASFSDEELIAELKRRIARADEMKAALASLSGPSTAMKSSNVSKAKAEYWADWHAYKAAHPGATVTEWRKAQGKQHRKLR